MQRYHDHGEATGVSSTGHKPQAQSVLTGSVGPLEVKVSFYPHNVPAGHTLKTTSCWIVPSFPAILPEIRSVTTCPALGGQLVGNVVL